jgi:hypothetical protein
MRMRWLLGGRVHEQDVVTVRPGHLKRFLEDFPTYATWNRCYLAWLNVVVLVESPLASGALAPKADPRDLEWSALLDERITITSEAGRG